MTEPSQSKVDTMLELTHQQSASKVDYHHLYLQEFAKNKSLTEEFSRLKLTMPEDASEQRLRERQVMDRMSRYEQAILDYENEQRALNADLK